MKIFTGEQPKNPCEGCDADCEEHNEHLDGDENYRSTCPAVIAYMAQLYILNQCVEIEKGWRPEGYKNPYAMSRQDDIRRNDFEAGFDACIEAMEKKSHD